MRHQIRLSLKQFCDHLMYIIDPIHTSDAVILKAIYIYTNYCGTTDEVVVGLIDGP